MKIGHIIEHIIATMASVATAVGLIIFWIKDRLEKKYKRSDDYLKQIKAYFAEAIHLISSENNDNIRWHQAIEMLTIADELKDELTEPTHQHIFLLDFIVVGYKLCEVAKRIDDFRFFYGIKEYSNQDSTTLYSQSFSERMEYCYRISPDSLIELSLLIDKVSKSHFDLYTNKSSWKKVFKSDYFNQKTRNGNVNDISHFTRISMKSVMEYIGDFNEHTRKRLKNRASKVVKNLEIS